jgi:hypothetical protein
MSKPNKNTQVKPAVKSAGNAGAESGAEGTKPSDNAGAESGAEGTKPPDDKSADSGAKDTNTPENPGSEKGDEGTNNPDKEGTKSGAEGANTSNKEDTDTVQEKTKKPGIRVELILEAKTVLEIMNRLKCDRIYANSKKEYFTSENLAHLSEKGDTKKVSEINRNVLELLINGK